MGKGGGGKAPPVPSAAPVYTELSPEVRKKSEDARRKILSKLGREGTILAGLGGDAQTLGLIGLA